MIYLWGGGFSTAGGIFGFERALSLAGTYMSTPHQFQNFMIQNLKGIKLIFQLNIKNEST